MDQQKPPPSGEEEPTAGEVSHFPALDADVRKYYEQAREAERLFGGFPSGPLELARTQELLTRHLPVEPLKILDVGGGSGVYATWLADLGHRVHLVDPIALHVEQAREDLRVTAEVGDARQLSQPDGSVDVVLLLGPLYHLLYRDDRHLALTEARRVLRKGGFLFAAGISRFAALLDQLVRLDRLHEPDVMEVVVRATETGVFQGAAAGLFTNAYFHLPQELLDEVAEAGFAGGKVFNIEGPGFLMSDFESRWSDPARRGALLEAARLVEAEPSMLGASSHLLVVARAPL